MKKFKVGDRIEHMAYGKGTIVQSSIPEEDIAVKFDNEDNLPILATDIDIRSLTKIKED